MKRKRRTPVQTARKVREGEWMLAAGSELAEVLGIWRSPSRPGIGGGVPMRA